MRAAARLVAVLGAAAVAWLLFRAAPRDVTLVYDVGRREAASTLEVHIQRGGELVRRAEFRLPAGEGQVQHTVRLPDGRYRLAYRLAPQAAGPDAARPVEGVRELEVGESATIVVPLAP